MTRNLAFCRFTILEKESIKYERDLSTLTQLSMTKRLKQIRIKTGVVNRIAKEKQSYEKETETEKNRLLKLKDNGGDSHTLRKQEEVIQESAMMITDCQKRLTAAYADLKAVLENEKDLSEAEEFQNASKALELALPHF